MVRSDGTNSRSSTRKILAIGLVLIAVCLVAFFVASIVLQGKTDTQPPTLQIALASSDLSVGSNRVAFGIIDVQSGPVRESAVQVSSFYLGGGTQEGPIESVPATWRRWPAGPAGVYTASLSFDRAGLWGIVAGILYDGGVGDLATVQLDVKLQSATPAIGSAPPKSVTKTFDSAQRLELMTTDPDPDSELYRMTVAEALGVGRPAIISFATPAFCEMATCGPQVDVLKDLKEELGAEVNFIHVEAYDNPQEIKGDLSNARLVPAMVEWGLPSEPWTFVINERGLVAAKFEGFVTRAEIKEALDANGE